MTDTALAARVRGALRAIPDYPNPGIVFQDITPVLGNGPLFREVIEAMAAPFRGDGVTHVVGIEARGFILGGAVAAALGAGFVPVRKPGKLPSTALRASYSLEYGTDSLEIHADAIGKGDRALIVDDVIATGGTARAVAELVEKLGGQVALYAFLIELTFLPGRQKLAGYEVRSLIPY